MNIQGLQKLTLLDYPGQIACTIFCGGCNFRCPFCQNAALVHMPVDQASAMTETEIFAFLKKRQGILDGVCITGGEPLLQPDLAIFITRIKTLGYQVKLDTNGSRPEALRALVEAGLVDYVAMDVKNDPLHYAETVGLPSYDLAAVRTSIAYLLSGAVAFEFRTTVVREYHDAMRIEHLARWISGAPRYFLQAFSDRGDLLTPGLHGYDAADMEALCAVARSFIPQAAVRGL